MELPFVSVPVRLYRPANTVRYSVNDLIANSSVAAEVEALALKVEGYSTGTFLQLERLRVSTSDIGFWEIALRAWLFQANPQQAGGILSGDNAKIDLKRANFVGSMSGVLDSFNDGAHGILTPDNGGRILYRSSHPGVFVLLETLSPVLPSSGSTYFDVILEGLQIY